MTSPRSNMLVLGRFKCWIPRPRGRLVPLDLMLWSDRYTAGSRRAGVGNVPANAVETQPKDSVDSGIAYEHPARGQLPGPAIARDKNTPSRPDTSDTSDTSIGLSGPRRSCNSYGLPMCWQVVGGQAMDLVHSASGTAHQLCHYLSFKESSDSSMFLLKALLYLSIAKKFFHLAISRR